MRYFSISAVVVAAALPLLARADDNTSNQGKPVGPPNNMIVPSATELSMMAYTDSKCQTGGQSVPITDVGLKPLSLPNMAIKSLKITGSMATDSKFAFMIDPAKDSGARPVAYGTRLYTPADNITIEARLFGCPTIYNAFGVAALASANVYPQLLPLVWHQAGDDSSGKNDAWCLANDQINPWVKLDGGSAFTYFIFSRDCIDPNQKDDPAVGLIAPQYNCLRQLGPAGCDFPNKSPGAFDASVPGPM